MQVEKIDYNVNWQRFKRGTSIFIPCLNCNKARAEIRETLNRLKIKVLMKQVIADNIQGLRIWRV